MIGFVLPPLHIRRCLVADRTRLARQRPRVPLQQFQHVPDLIPAIVAPEFVQLVALADVRKGPWPALQVVDFHDGTPGAGPGSSRKVSTASSQWGQNMIRIGRDSETKNCSCPLHPAHPLPTQPPSFPETGTLALKLAQSSAFRHAKPHRGHCSPFRTIGVEQTGQTSAGGSLGDIDVMVMLRFLFFSRGSDFGTGKEHTKLNLHGVKA